MCNIICRNTSKINTQAYNYNSDDNRTANLVLPILKEDSRVEYVHRMEPSCKTGIGHLNYILRCNPYCKGGYDPVPEKKDSHRS